MMGAGRDGWDTRYDVIPAYAGHDVGVVAGISCPASDDVFVKTP